MRRRARGTSALAFVTSLALVVSGPVANAMQAAPAAPAKPAAAPTSKASTAPTKPAAAATKSPAGAPAPPIDGGWPRAYTTPSGGELLLYQPQVASWDDEKKMVAYSAVAYQPKGAQKPELGTIKIESNTRVALPERLVRFATLQVTEAHFEKLSRDQTREVVAQIVDSIPDAERVIALDRVLANVDKSQILPKEIPGLKSDPPPIFYSTKPAVLVNLDGEAIWSPIRDNDLKFAINTNWDLFLNDPTKTFYLRNDQTWLKAPDLDGPWTAAGKLPKSFSSLPADDNWKDVKAALPGRKISDAEVPGVFISKKPAEMILVKGEPSYQLVEGTKDLYWLQNTDSDVFRVGKTGPIYFLVAGRWFTASAFSGPWTFATPSLPDVFKQIPLEHPRSRVLAAVPGTPQATEAILLSQVPQTARVNRKTITAPEVAYNGDPKFEPIEQTTVSRAVNTDKTIIKVGDLYYLCFQGVWFMARSAEGPWEVTSSVPKEIYQIPPSSPAYNVTYVTVVEDDTDDEWVTFAAVAGYTGMMVAYGCVVWGSGYYYPPYWGWGGYYPYYYPFYPTYGYGAWYNPWTGAYGRSMVAYGPYGGAGVAARYNPRTGTYSRAAGAWGPYGARGYADAYNPRTGTYARTRQGSNVYGSWGSTSVQRGDEWARTARVTNNRTGNTTRVSQGSGGGEAITRRGPSGSGGVARTGGGDVYAGRDGNVYRNQGGGWQKYENGGWNNVDTPDRPRPNETGTRASDRAGNTADTRPADRAGDAAATRPADRGTVGQLDRDRAARTDGATRTRDAGTYQRGSGGSTSGYGGSYRPSGGGMRSGGMRGGGRRR
jgi:hypothetical protein